MEQSQPFVTIGWLITDLASYIKEPAVGGCPNSPHSSFALPQTAAASRRSAHLGARPCRPLVERPLGPGRRLGLVPHSSMRGLRLPLCGSGRPAATRALQAAAGAHARQQSASASGRRAPERRRPSWRATRRGTHARPPLGALGLGPAAAYWPLSCRLRAAGAQAPQSQPPHARGAAPAGGRLSGTASQVAARGRVCRLRAMATRGSVARVSGPRGEHRPPLQPDAGAAASRRRLGPRVPPARAGCSGPAGLLMAPPRALPPAPRALKPRAAPSGRPCRGAQQRMYS